MTSILLALALLLVATISLLIRRTGICFRMFFTITFAILCLAVMGHGQTVAPNTAPPSVADDGLGNKQLMDQGRFLYYSPAALGANAITLPSMDVTSAFPSTPVNMTNVHAGSLYVNCGQASDISVVTYAEDGTTALGTFRIVTAEAAGNQMIFFSDNSDLATTGGTADKKFRLPARALKFQALNTTMSASTCTARLYLSF